MNGCGNETCLPLSFGSNLYRIINQKLESDNFNYPKYFCEPNLELPEQNENWYTKKVSDILSRASDECGKTQELFLNRSVKDGLDLMEKIGVTELPVLSESGSLAGLFSQGT